MASKVYVETTIVSYLTALPSRDIVQAAHQQVTRDWWERRSRFELFVSQTVRTEAARGDPAAAGRRPDALRGISVLTITDEVTTFAEHLLRAGTMPESAAVDALHVAVAVVNGLDYLVTWNCSHIANAAIRHKIEQGCRENGFEPPIICTPEELLEDWA
jgi:hypothetical protein